MRTSYKNSVANHSPKALSSRHHYRHDGAISDRRRSPPEIITQGSNNPLPSFFANFIKSPQSFGLTKETKPNEYFINMSNENGNSGAKHPSKTPYFLKEGAPSNNKPRYEGANERYYNGQSYDLPHNKQETSGTMASQPNSFAHFNRFRENTSRVGEGQQKDFFDVPVGVRQQAAVTRAKTTEQSCERDCSPYEHSYNSIRPAGASKAYADAMKALQEQVKALNEKVDNLEAENEFYQKFQKEQLEKIEQDYQTKIDGYQLSSRNIQDGLTNLEWETVQLTNAKKDLEEKVKVMSKENKKLKEDKTRLKKKVESLNADMKFREETFTELGNRLNEAKEAINESVQEYKVKEEKWLEELAGLRKEKEELRNTNRSLSEKVNKLEKDLAGNKKTYSQHVQQLSLANEALKLDNNKLKGSYGDQLAEFQAELDAIHENHLKRVNKFETTIADLTKENKKFKELISLKNKEIEGLKMRASQSQTLKDIRLAQSNIAEDYFLKDSVFDKSKLSLKNSKHIETSMIENSAGYTTNKREALNVSQHSPAQLRNYARRLLSDEDNSEDRSTLKVSFNYTTASPERVKDKVDEVLPSPKRRHSPVKAVVGERVSTAESLYLNNKSVQPLLEKKAEENNRQERRKSGSPNKHNGPVNKEDELSLSSIFTENNNSFTRREVSKSPFIVENFKDRLAAANNNKFALSSDDTSRRHTYSNYQSDTDRNNSSREYINTLKKFNKNPPSNFSFGDPKSFRPSTIDESDHKVTLRSSIGTPSNKLEIKCY